MHKPCPQFITLGTVSVASSQGSLIFSVLKRSGAWGTVLTSLCCVTLKTGSGLGMRLTCNKHQVTVVPFMRTNCASSNLRISEVHMSCTSLFCACVRVEMIMTRWKMGLQLQVC